MARIEDTYVIDKEGLFGSKETIYDKYTGEKICETIYNKKGRVISFKDSNDIQKSAAIKKRKILGSLYIAGVGFALGVSMTNLINSYTSKPNDLIALEKSLEGEPISKDDLKDYYLRLDAYEKSLESELEPGIIPSSVEENVIEDKLDVSKQNSSIFTVEEANPSYGVVSVSNSQLIDNTSMGEIETVKNSDDRQAYYSELDSKISEIERARKVKEEYERDLQLELEKKAREEALKKAQEVKLNQSEDEFKKSDENDIDTIDIIDDIDSTSIDDLLKSLDVNEKGNSL